MILLRRAPYPWSRPLPSRFGLAMRFLGFLAVLCILSAPSARAAESHEEFNLEKGRVGKENLFNLIFGSVPSMPTERGILVIDAFHDRNGNGQRDADEDDLSQEVFCLVDDVEYLVPAFIPGLALDGSYQVLCAGDRFRPDVSEKNIFIRSRGEIIQLDIPCSPMSQSTGSSHQPSTSGK